MAAAATTERRARVHLKLDTGLSRNGAAAGGLAGGLRGRGGGARRPGRWRWSASGRTSPRPTSSGHPSVAAQVAAFQRGYEVARAAGLEPALRHLANSAGALVVPEARLDLVRVGIAAYGIDPAPGIAAAAGVRSGR